MAPVCVCGHKASEHKKQMRMRTSCLQPQCECTLYRPKEESK